MSMDIGLRDGEMKTFEYGLKLRERYKHLGPGWMGFHRAYAAGLLTAEDKENEDLENFVSPSLMQIALMEMIANTIRELHTTKLEKLNEQARRAAGG